MVANSVTIINVEEERKRFYDDFPEFYPDMYEMPYALLGSVNMDRELVEKIREAGNSLWTIFKKTKDALLNEPYYLGRLGLPEKLIPFLDLDYLTNDTFLSRFDFIVNESGDIKLMEINNDTPFLIMEAYYMNYYVNEYLYGEEFEVKDVNTESYLHLMSSLLNVVRDSVTHLGKDKLNIHFTSYDIEEEEEDYKIANYIYDVAKEEIMFDERINEIKHTLLGDLTITDEGLFDSENNRIDVLFRTGYPLEALITDTHKDDPSINIGVQMLQLVKDHKLVIVSPPSSIILQNKNIFSVIHELNEKGFYSDEESLVIEKHLLKTYNKPSYFISNNIPYVKKSILGREGSTVEIYDENNNLTTSSDDNRFENRYDYVYQEYCELPKISVNDQAYHYIFGLFIANDTSSALGIRLGGKITQWDALWMAISYND